MHLPTVAAVLAVGLAHAAPTALTAANVSSIILLHTRIMDTGRLEYWGLPSPDGVASKFNWDDGWDDPAESWVPEPALQRRCGGNHVHCHDSNIAHGNVCDIMINILRNNPGAAIDPLAIGVYWIEGNTRCGVSWHHSDIPNMRNGYLVNAALKTRASCTRDTHIARDVVSGYATEVSLNGVCTVQCLSMATTCFRFDQG